MLKGRSFYSSRDPVDLRSYIERVDPELCHLCKDRKYGSHSLVDDQVPVCDVCVEKAVDGRTNFLRYIEDVTELSSKTIDLTKINEGEEILGEVIYPEETRLSPPEHICRISEEGFYVAPFKCRWTSTKLKEGYLVSEMNTNIGFILPEEGSTELDPIPENMNEHPEYVLLYPSRTFAHKITSEQLAANTI